MFFKFVSVPYSFYSDGRGEGIIMAIISILIGIITIEASAGGEAICACAQVLL